MSISLGTDLWDKTEAIISFNENNSLIIDRFQKIIGDFCKAQLTTSSTQKRLIEKFLAENDTLKKSDFNFSLNGYFLTEKILDIINAQETFGDALLNEVDEIIKTKGANIKKESKIIKNEKKKLFDDLAKENQKLDNDFRKYRKRYNEKDAAHIALIKAEENKALSRNQVDSFQSIYTTRKCQCDEAMHEYEKTLEIFNKYQANHFSHSLGEWGLKAQVVEEERYNIMKSTFTNIAEICRSLASKFNEIADNIELRKDTIEYKEDCITLVNQEKTGDVPPQDIPFQDFENQEKIEIGLNDARTSKPSNSGSDSTNSNNGQKNNKSEIKKKSLSLSRIYSSILSKENGPGTNGSAVNNYSVFGKLFGGSKRNKEINTEVISSDIETLESHLEQRLSSNNGKEFKQKFNGNTNSSENGRNSCIESKKSESLRRKWLFTSMKYQSHNKSLDDPSIYVKNRSFIGRLNIRSQYGKCRSKSMSGVIDDQIDNITEKPIIRLKKPTFSINRKVAKSKLFLKPVIRRHLSPDTKREQSYKLYSKTIEVVGIVGPVEIVSTPAEALASAGRCNSALKPDVAECYADGEISKTEESAIFHYNYIGSCVAIHKYKSLDMSNLYLSFDIGEQFYIIEEKDSNVDSGWMLVEKVDRLQCGYVPTSYMDIREFETPIHMSSDHPLLMT